MNIILRNVTMQNVKAKTSPRLTDLHNDSRRVILLQSKDVFDFRDEAFCCLPTTFSTSDYNILMKLEERAV